MNAIPWPLSMKLSVKVGHAIKINQSIDSFILIIIYSRTVKFGSKKKKNGKNKK